MKQMNMWTAGHRGARHGKFFYKSDNFRVMHTASTMLDYNLGHLGQQLQLHTTAVTTINKMLQHIQWRLPNTYINKHIHHISN